MNRLGGASAGGIERRNVVEVPRERRASPGADSAITVAGLSPVNGATIQSKISFNPGIQDAVYGRYTWMESPFLNPPGIDATKYGASNNRIGSQFGTQFWPSTCLEKAFFPFTGEYVHEIHPARVRDFNGDDTAKEEGRDK